MTPTRNLVVLGACLSRGAWKAGTPGSEGAGTQQCVPATRRFHIQWRRKRGTSTWHVYTFVSDRAIRQVKAKIRALTRKTSPLDLDATLAQLNMVRGGWAFYFQHAIAKRVFSKLDTFTWWRVARLLRERHRWGWKELRRRHTTPTGRWLPFAANGVELRNIQTIPVTRYRYRGNKIPNPWVPEAC
ncbi:group II intron maturase-specific domain-containing protein [Streptomyces sp. NPDC055059]